MQREYAIISCSHPKNASFLRLADLNREELGLSVRAFHESSAQPRSNLRQQEVATDSNQLDGYGDMLLSAALANCEKIVPTHPFPLRDRQEFPKRPLTR